MLNSQAYKLSIVALQAKVLLLIECNKRNIDIDVNFDTENNLYHDFDVERVKRVILNLLIHLSQYLQPNSTIYI